MAENHLDNVAGVLAALEQRLQILLQTVRSDQEHLATEQLRALLRTAEAVEEIARQGVKLQEPPPAVWGP